MPSLRTPQLLCFDVYGTLIDWETGLLTAMDPLISRIPSRPSRTEFLQSYDTLERAQQAKTPGLRYPELLSKVYIQLAEHYGLDAPSEPEATAFGQSIKDWPAYPDSAAALKELKGHYKLVVLSNVDRASFATSLEKLGGEGAFDAIFTAEDIGSYKPDLKNFEYMLKEVREMWGIEREVVCSTANSLWHDHLPAKKLGLLGAWIVRPGTTLGQVEGPKYEWKFDTLGNMAEAVRGEKNGC